MQVDAKYLSDGKYHPDYYIEENDNGFSVMHNRYPREFYIIYCGDNPSDALLALLKYKCGLIGRRYNEFIENKGARK